MVEPFDEHNQRTLQNVHPADWVNPEPGGRYNLVVGWSGHLTNQRESKERHGDDDEKGRPSRGAASGRATVEIALVAV